VAQAVEEDLVVGVTKDVETLMMCATVIAPDWENLNVDKPDWVCYGIMAQKIRMARIDLMVILMMEKITNVKSFFYLKIKFNKTSKFIN
jgi:hypothetical protein